MSIVHDDGVGPVRLCQKRTGAPVARYANGCRAVQQQWLVADIARSVVVTD